MTCGDFSATMKTDTWAGTIPVTNGMVATLLGMGWKIRGAWHLFAEEGVSVPRGRFWAEMCFVCEESPDRAFIQVTTLYVPGTERNGKLSFRLRAQPLEGQGVALAAVVYDEPSLNSWAGRTLDFLPPGPMELLAATGEEKSGS